MATHLIGICFIFATFPSRTSTSFSSSSYSSSTPSPLSTLFPFFLVTRGMSGTSADSVPNFQFEFKWQDDTLNTINVIGNSLSVASGMVVLIIILGLRIYDKQLVDRVSLRLSAAISVTDVISSAALLIYTFVTVEGGACVLSPFLIIFLTNLFLFLTTVSINLLINSHRVITTKP